MAPCPGLAAQRLSAGWIFRQRRAYLQAAATEARRAGERDFHHAGRISLSRISEPRRAGGAGRRTARGAGAVAAVHAAHAAHRQAVFGPDDQSGAARLGVRCAGLSLSAAASRDGPAMGADPGATARRLGRACAGCAAAGSLPRQFLRFRGADGAASGSRRAASLRRRSCRCRWGMRRCSGSARMSASGPTRSFRLQSGDAFVFGGPARLAFHGVDRIYPGTSTLLAKGGRINLTLRRVTAAV